MKLSLLFLLLSCGNAFGRVEFQSKKEAKNATTNDAGQCPKTLEWFDCSYNVSCIDYDPNSKTRLNCSPGCYCPIDHYQHKDGCYRYKDCPNVIKARRDCPSPLVWDDCYFNISCSVYPITSSEYEKKPCKPGCYCPQDHYVYNNKCFFYSECPDDCTSGRRWDECGNYCHELCPALQPKDGCRSAPNCSTGCFCKHGRRSFAGHCLKLEDCPTNIQKTVLSEIKSDFAFMEL